MIVLNRTQAVMRNLKQKLKDERRNVLGLSYCYYYYRYYYYYYSLNQRTDDYYLTRDDDSLMPPS